MTVLTLASVFPEELTALRASGLVFAVLLIAFAIWRRRELSNAAVLLAIFGGMALAVVSGTELLDALLSAFAFERGNGGRILGLAVFAIAILFLLVLRALTESARMNQQLSALLEGLAWEEFRQAKLPERFRDKVAVVIPAYNESESVGDVVRQIPPEVCGEPTSILVVDDGSRDDTGDEAARAGAVVARHVINRGGGAALRTGYRLMAESGA
ncbi:MAG TPA: glycosyltransferase, partial [Solirubrobacterales bacterium]|nr:glycosyltransferase [Solirubrobacterales bacterium]